MAVDFRAAFAQILAKLELLKTAVQNNTFFEFVSGTIIKLKDSYNEIRHETDTITIKTIIRFLTAINPEPLSKPP